jgi:pimeloyl-ACP methyl ester carboxylesterase
MRTPTAALARSDVGHGAPALLCLPGWCGGREVFAPLLDSTGDRRRTMSLDWPGHGESPPADGDFGSEELAAAVLGLIDELGLDTVVPVALSHAGWIALEIRRRLGSTRVPAVVLIDWMPLGPPPGFLDALVALQDPDRWTNVRDRLFAMWADGVVDPAVTNYIHSMAGYGFDMWARAAREISRAFSAEGSPVDALTALAQAEEPCPTLHLFAQPNDPQHLNAQQAFAIRHPWFRVHHIPANSHFPCLERPQESAAAIDAFLDEVA